MTTLNSQTNASPSPPETLPKYNDLFGGGGGGREKSNTSKKCPNCLSMFGAILSFLGVLGCIFFGLWCLMELANLRINPIRFHRSPKWCNVMHDCGRTNAFSSQPKSIRVPAYSRFYGNVPNSECDYRQSVKTEPNVHRVNVLPLNPNSVIAKTRIVHDFRVNFTGVLTTFGDCYIMDLDPSSYRNVHPPLSLFGVTNILDSHFLWNEKFVKKSVRIKYPALTPEEVSKFGPVIEDLCKPALKTYMLYDKQDELPSSFPTEMYPIEETMRLTAKQHTRVSSSSSSSSSSASSSGSNSTSSSDSTSSSASSQSSRHIKREIVRVKQSSGVKNQMAKAANGKGLESSSSSDSVGSYEYCGRLVVVKRKPPIIFETDNTSPYGRGYVSPRSYKSSSSYVCSRSRSYSAGSHAGYISRRRPYVGGSYAYDNGEIDRYCLGENTNYGNYSRRITKTNYDDTDVRLIGRADPPVRGELVYDSGYYRVTDPDYRSPRLKDILEFKMSKRNSYEQHQHSHDYQNDYCYHPTQQSSRIGSAQSSRRSGYFERELSKNLNSSFAH